MTDSTVPRMNLSPEDLRMLYSLANKLKAQMLRLFTKPYNPDLLPVWPPPTEPRVRHKLTASQRRAVAAREYRELTTPKSRCPYYPWLRAELTRALLLDAWRKLSNPDRIRDTTAANSAASRLLRHMFTLYYGSKVGETIARHTTVPSRDRLTEGEAADVLGADSIKVRALSRLRWNIEPGTEIKVPALEFLEAAYARARFDRDPPYEPTGKSPVGWKASNCWRLLALLGHRLRANPQGTTSQNVTVVTILRELDIRPSGNRHRSMCRLIDGLASIGLVHVRQTEKGRAVRLRLPRVKRPPAGTDAKEK